tara:strand:- start:638 stop:949 length:312 start_codon:yes stop_codon:yes gene_type:complete
MISHKLEAISKSGVDISGYREIEFEFKLNTKILAEELCQNFYHPDNSMRAKMGQNHNGFGYWVRLRIDSVLTEEKLASSLLRFNRKSQKFNATLMNWRVVVRT